MASNNVPDGVRLIFRSDCGKGGDVIETQNCVDVELGTSVTFHVDVRASRCVDNGRSVFTISPVGLNQSLVVEVETLCQCGCEIPGDLFYKL